MRLDKFVAQTSSHSRSEVKKLLKDKAVMVNGSICCDAGYKVDEATDVICLWGKTLQTRQARYLMLHKPKNTVCATRDSEHPTVLDLLDLPHKSQLQIVGRLDKDTTGLVLITDDGQWNHRVSSPNKACTKIYEVTVERALDETLIPLFAQGISLKNETKTLRPALLTIIDTYRAKLAIEEGKYHQVKRMFAAVGNHVMELHRSQIGPLALDPQLAPNEYRHLTSEEVNYFAI